jgi:excisionase family DNA binding protein
MEVENLFRVEELSRIWRVSKSTIYRQIKSGELKSIKLGGSRLVSTSQALTFLQTCKEVTNCK